MKIERVFPVLIEGSHFILITLVDESPKYKSYRLLLNLDNLNQQGFSYSSMKISEDGDRILFDNFIVSMDDILTIKLRGDFNNQDTGLIKSIISRYKQEHEELRKLVNSFFDLKFDRNYEKLIVEVNSISNLLLGHLNEEDSFFYPSIGDGAVNAIYFYNDVFQDYFSVINKMTKEKNSEDLIELKRILKKVIARIDFEEDVIFPKVEEILSDISSG